MAYTFQAPHKATDKAKFTAMVETLKSGGTLPPVVAIGETALTGSHRLAAWRACGIDAVAVEVADEDFIAAMEVFGLDAMYDNPPSDLNLFCETLYGITTDEAVKAALEDQIA